MGSCWNCGIQVTLSEDNVKCPSCHETLWYKCWSCGQPFEVADERGKKRKECVVCKFFYCPNCLVCGNNCKKRNWEKFLIGKELPKDSKEIIEYFGVQKVGSEEKRCPRDVGISYGKGKIKTCFCKMNGYNMKNDDDVECFRKRLDEISNIPIGTSSTINKIRQSGTYGLEYRDVFNMAICLGLFKIERVPKPDGVDIQMFTRIDGKFCPYWNAEKMVYKKCLNHKCKIIEHPINAEYCSQCINKKGKNKGLPFKLKLIKSDKDICQFNRNDYKKIEKEEEREDGRITEED